MTQFIIFPEDLKILEVMVKRLFSEERMDADTMRDTAERLRLLIERAKQCEVGDIDLLGYYGKPRS